MSHFKYVVFLEDVIFFFIYIKYRFRIDRVNKTDKPAVLIEPQVPNVEAIASR